MPNDNSNDSNNNTRSGSTNNITFSLSSSEDVQPRVVATNLYDLTEMASNLYIDTNSLTWSWLSRSAEYKIETNGFFTDTSNDSKVRLDMNYYKSEWISVPGFGRFNSRLIRNYSNVLYNKKQRTIYFLESLLYDLGILG